MLTATYSTTKLRRAGFIIALSIPFALCLLLLTQMLRLHLSNIVALCGVILAIVGGCTKIGSA